MKKYFKYLIIVALVFTLPAMSVALEFRVGEQPSVKKSEKITNDVYLIGGSVNSAGKVEGDLIAGGGNIVISGNVGGDVMAGGGNINILSDVGDDVRIGGGTVVLQGKIKGDVLIGGGQVSIGGSGVGGDVAIGGGNVRIDAPVAGNLLVGGGNVYINAPINGNVKIEADKVTLGSGALISGNLTYKAKSELIKEEGAVIKGEVKFEPRPKREFSTKSFIAIISALLLWKFFTLFACALLVGLVFRRYCREIVILGTHRPFYEMGKGLLAFIAIPIVSFLLFFTVVGIPFGVVGLLGFVILILFAWILAPIILGSYVYKYIFKKGDEVSWKTILLGVFIYSLLSLVPFLGHLIKTLLILLTLGSMITLKTKIIREWR